ncbi:proton-conducting transporter membrane subunit, partial [Arthrospira platensis SPKY1]|nr:proton-conducting transporter membrane subunit [Arthrospira platensis SPKY1]
VALTVLAGPVEFVQGAQLANFIESHPLELKLIFWMMLAGLAVKAAIFPVHGWLPVAMVAPAPVSALLHAVAVVKAGAFGIIRLIYDVYGVELAMELSVLPPLAFLAAFT